MFYGLEDSNNTIYRDKIVLNLNYISSPFHILGRNYGAGSFSEIFCHQLGNFKSSEMLGVGRKSEPALFFLLAWHRLGQLSHAIIINPA